MFDCLNIYSLGGNFFANLSTYCFEHSKLKSIVGEYISIKFHRKPTIEQARYYMVKGSIKEINTDPQTDSRSC